MFAQCVHKAHMTGRNWDFCYWQYSCLYKPHYTPTMLDSLMFYPNPIPQATKGPNLSPQHDLTKEDAQ